jgi:tetratricopeptide (TPR) repeat protein
MISNQVGGAQSQGWGQTSQVEALESKDDFGNVVRRIMYSNSGKFHKFDAEPETKSEEAQKVMPVTNVNWEHYKNEAELAAKYGNTDKADAMWKAALEVAESFSAKDPRLAYTLDNVASIYAASNRLDIAEGYCKRALATTEMIYGRHHLKTAHCMNNLAGIYYNQRRYFEAEQLCVQVLMTYNKLLGPDHADVGMAANNLAMAYHSQGKWGLADLLYERALPIRKRTLGKNHPIVAALVENYANVMEHLGRHEKAQSLRDELKNSGIWHLFETRVPLFQTA